jgi:hypothetical protein
VSAPVTRRAERLVRCYPAAWRLRYGEEFTQLLIDDMAERPRSLERTADVLRAGLLARLSSLGLAGEASDPTAQMRATLTAVGGVLTAFLVAGIAMWSHARRCSLCLEPLCVWGCSLCSPAFCWDARHAVPLRAVAQETCSAR